MRLKVTSKKGDAGPSAVETETPCIHISYRGGGGAEGNKNPLRLMFYAVGSDKIPGFPLQRDDKLSDYIGLLFLHDLQPPKCSSDGAAVFKRDCLLCLAGVGTEKLYLDFFTKCRLGLCGKISVKRTKIKEVVQKFVNSTR